MPQLPYRNSLYNPKRLEQGAGNLKKTGSTKDFSQKQDSHNANKSTFKQQF